MRPELERRIYKIYINDIPLYLVHRESRSEIENLLPQDVLVLTYTGRKHSLINCIDILEKEGREAIVVQTDGAVEELFATFKSLFHRVKACGGLVLSPDRKRVLMIKRRGFWDLPKGKMEPKERKSQTARREVEEETGVQVLMVKEKLVTTRHTFKKKDGTRVLKINHWFVMIGDDQKRLIPQTEEDITKVQWVPFQEAFLKSPMFNSIEDVLLAFQKLPGDDQFLDL